MCSKQIPLSPLRTQNWKAKILHFFIFILIYYHCLCPAVGNIVCETVLNRPNACQSEIFSWKSMIEISDGNQLRVFYPCLKMQNENSIKTGNTKLDWLVKMRLL